MFFFKEKQSPRSKELTDRYATILATKEADNAQFKNELFGLVKDITEYLKEADQKEQFVKIFCTNVDQILANLDELKIYIDTAEEFGILTNFIKTLVSVKTPFNPQIKNLLHILEILEKSNDKSIDEIFGSLFNNENWIYFIEYNNYFPGISKLNEESLVRRNTIIFDSLSNQIKNYHKKNIQSYVEILSRLSDRIPKTLRYPYSNLLYNIFIISDDYFKTFKKKSGYDILIKLFKSSKDDSSQEVKSGGEMSDFFCLFLYKEFYKFLYEMIIEDEPKLNRQSENNDEDLNARTLIEKYSFKLACLNSLITVVDQISPEMFKLTKEQMINIGKVQLMECSDPSFNSKVEENELLLKIKNHYSIAFARLMTQLRTKIWKKDAKSIDNVMLKDFWSQEDGMNYFVNIQNPSFLDYHTQYFKKFESWNSIFERMEKSDSLIALFILLFSLPKGKEYQTEDNVNYLKHVYDIYETRNNLFNRIIKRIIRLSFYHFLFVLKNSPTDEIFNAITVLSFDDCYSNYDFDSYSIFLKYSLHFNKKLHEVDNFKKMLKIYNIELDSSKQPTSSQLYYLALLLLDKSVMASESTEIVSLACDTISTNQFDSKSCIDRLAFRILQEVDFDVENAFKVLSVFQPSINSIPLYVSINPMSTYLNEQFLCTGMDQFDYFTALNILPRTYVKRLFFESELASKKSNPAILTAALQLWPFMYDKGNEENSFKYFKEIIMSLLKNKNNDHQEAIDVAMLTLCLLHFNRVLSDNDYLTLFELFVTELKNDPSKEFWFSVLFSSNKLSTNFLPLPFHDKEHQQNLMNNENSTSLEFTYEMPTFDTYDIKKKTKMTLSCLTPFTNDNYKITEESSTNSNDFTKSEINKQTIHPNKEIIDDENTTLDLTNWQTFVRTLLLISDQIDSKKKENERLTKQNIEFVHINLIQAMINLLYDNNTYKFKVNSNFLKAAFFGNPYEDLSEIQATLQIFIEFFTRQRTTKTFDKDVFDFFLDCAIDGWFCEKIGVVLNSLFGYYNQFKKKATNKMLTAYKLGFDYITLSEVEIFLCLMREYESLFFSIFKREDYFFYYNRIVEIRKNAEEAKTKENPKKINFDSIITKCRYTINLLNRKYHEIILRNKKQIHKNTSPKKENEKSNHEINEDESKQEKVTHNENENQIVEEETKESKEANNNDNKESNENENKEEAANENQIAVEEEEVDEVENKEVTENENKEAASNENQIVVEEEEVDDEENKEANDNNNSNDNDNKVNNESENKEATSNENQIVVEEEEEVDDEENKEVNDNNNNNNDNDNKEEDHLAVNASENQGASTLEIIKELENNTINEEEEEDNEVTNTEIDDSITSNEFSTEEFSDADDEEFVKYDKSKKEKYEKSLKTVRNSHESSIRKFRIDHKTSFDTRILTTMDFVYREVKGSEMIGENYRKIWTDSNNFDDSLLLRKAEYELGDVFGHRIDIKKPFFISRQKELLFTEIQVLTGIKTSTNVNDINDDVDKNANLIFVKLNGVDGACFFGENKIVFVEGLGSDGEFVKDENQSKKDKNYAKIVDISKRFEGHVLFEILRKDMNKVSVSKSVAKFDYLDIKIVIECLSDEESKMAKLFS